MERSSTSHSSLTPSPCFLAQVAPFSPLGTQNAIFSFFPPGFDFSCAGDALDFYFCSCSSRPCLLSPSSSPLASRDPERDLLLLS